MKEIIRNNLKQLFDSARNRIKSVYVKTENYLRNNIKHGGNTNYKELSPTENVENGDEYLKALNWALRKEEIFNIALSGPYGSGKSSIIKAYQKRHPSTQSINISLASFYEVKADGEPSVVDSGNRDKIEEGILKQLFYKVNYKKIPRSRYRKLHNVHGIRIFFKLMLITIIIGVALFCFSPNIYETAIDNIASFSSIVGIEIREAKIVAVFSITALLGAISYALWWASSKYRIKEVNFANSASVAKEEGNQESIFNKNMDEIVYFFEATKYNVVFIEDLDRFQNVEIFIRLREINSILNNYEMIKRKIVFVYAIRDDIFVDKDRTKFFDFIIPIIPVINGTNSGEILGERLEMTNQEEGTFRCNISPKYITQISPYIDDMRILTNIYNEFVVYKKTLVDDQKLDLKDENMMSLMLLKNLYPSSFAGLQMETGVIKQAFTDKGDFIKTKITKLDQDRKSKQALIEKVEGDVGEEIKKLKLALFYYMSTEKGMVYALEVDGASYTFETIMSDDFDMEILKDQSILVRYCYGSGNANANTIQNIESFLIESGEQKQSYIERWKELNACSPERKKQILKSIDELKMQEHKIRSMKMRDLLAMYDTEEVLSEKVRENKLLVYLLKNGYVDETYANYINNFHGNSITNADMNFILSVRNEEAREFSYSLTKCKQVVDRLLEGEFEQEEIYNFDLLKHLLKEQTESKKCDVFLRQLSNGKEVSWRFIDEFVEFLEVQPVFINNLSKRWYGMWNHIAFDSMLSEERKMFYFKLIVEYAAIDDIENMDWFNEDYKGSAMQAFIHSHTDILKQLKDINHSKVIEVLGKLEPAFSNIQCEGVNANILNYIFDHGMFELNINMISNVFSFKQASIKDLLRCNFTEVRKLQYQPLLERINEYFVQYMENVILGLETNVDESMDTVLFIIHKIFEEPEKCCEVIKKENVVLESFKDCCFEKIEESDAKKEDVRIIWNTFLETEKVVVCWENIMIYWEQFELTSTLLDYVVKKWDELKISDDKHLVSAEFVEAFIAEEINPPTYKEFLQAFKLDSFEFGLSQFSQEQLEIMLDIQYFLLVPKYLKEMRAIYPELCIPFILHDKKEFFENISEYELTDEEVEQLILSVGTNESEKIKLLKLLPVEEISKEIANVVRDIKIPVEKAVLEQCWELLDEDKRYELFLNQISEYSIKEISQKLNALGGVYASLGDCSRRHEVKLHDTDYNWRLVEHLFSRGYLTSRSHEVKELENHLTYQKEKISRIIARVRKRGK